jgi:hypothetical protein
MADILGVTLHSLLTCIPKIHSENVFCIFDPAYSSFPVFVLAETITQTVLGTLQKIDILLERSVSSRFASNQPCFIIKMNIRSKQPSNDNNNALNCKDTIHSINQIKHAIIQVQLSKLTH